jgi:hypothetical protein
MAKKSTGAVTAEVGAGVAAAAAAAAAGYYFYASKDAKKHRKIAAKWADGMRKDVVREAKKLQSVDAKTVARVIDTAARGYAGVRAVDPSEVRRAAKELKANWEMIRREAGKEAKHARKAAKKTAKKAVSRAKKTVKKVARKSRR